MQCLAGGCCRYGFNNPPNFNDHEIYCGGFTRQWQTNRGRCGVCGDPWDTPQPRDNEGGGRYGRGTIARVYTAASVIAAKVELTANHQGYFEFRLCPQNNPLVPATQACLDRHLLEVVGPGGGAEGGAATRYLPGPGNRVFEVELQLPAGLTCAQCVLQWRYVAANNWGVCEDGSGRVGCGPQEEFRACSDVSITDEAGWADTEPNTDTDTAEEEEVVEYYEEVEDNSLDWGQHPVPLEAGGDTAERTAVIVLASLLTAVLLFAGLFLYYYKLRALLSTLDLPPLPALPSLPHLPDTCRPRLPRLAGKLASPRWPLANVSLPAKLQLPSFSAPAKAKVRPRPEISAPVPIPPPRARRGRSRATSPGPAAAAVLDISSPTEVTINGVTVAGSSAGSVMGRTAEHGPTPSSRGVVCGPAPAPGPVVGGAVRSVWAAQPALVISDQPDSSLGSVPPPLPDCPPPEDSLVLGPGSEDTEA